MARVKTVYSCQACAYQSYKWLGRCLDCGAWNSFVEERVAKEGPSARGVVRRGEEPGPHPVTDVPGTEEYRVRTSITELDRVLGGGMVPGSAVLVGGDPGIGKSTLLLQAMCSYASAGNRVLYVSGEESARQIRMRAERIGALSPNLMVFTETSVERVIDTVSELKPSACVIDSIQTMHTDLIESAPGSVSQVRESSSMLIRAAKSLDIPLFLVGHVTKEGAIAGPRVLEHMVDTVLYFEGERGHPYRVVRATKNRFGSVMEIGVFEMKDSGLAEVPNPSEIFLAERPEGVTGSAVVASLEGTRTLLVEVQSLVSPTIFGMPRRTVVGMDYNRVMLVAAVLEKKAGITLTNHDIFVKVAGGIRLDEPAVDLGVAASIASNHLDRSVDPKTVVFGELGLAGEIRGVSQASQRVKEAGKLGFKRCVMPRDNMKGLEKTKGVEVIGVSGIREAVGKLFG